MYEHFVGFTNLLKKCTEFQVFVASENKDIMDTLLDKIETVGVDSSYLETFDRIYWIIIESDKYNIEDILRKKLGTAYSSHDNVLFFEVNEKQTDIYVFDVHKTKTKNRRKTMEILNIELADAVKAEEYEKAEKIKKQIEIKLKKRKK